jgi:hypothetical protein
MRKTLLPLSHTLAHLPDSEKKLLEDEESMWNAGSDLLGCCSLLDSIVSFLVQDGLTAKKSWATSPTLPKAVSMPILCMMLLNQNKFASFLFLARLCRFFTVVLSKGPKEVPLFLPQKPLAH